jgi:hypothetical protein
MININLIPYGTAALWFLDDYTIFKHWVFSKREDDLVIIHTFFLKII